MPRGRARNSDPPVYTQVAIRKSLLTQTDLLLVDPIRGKPIYGARSKLINRLLSNWLADVKRGKASIRDYVGDLQ